MRKEETRREGKDKGKGTHRRTFVVEHPLVGPGSPPWPMVIDYVWEG